MTKIDNKAILKWNSVNQLVNLVAKFIISIILQRILQPADFGIIANVFVFASITEIFIDSGFQSSIIQAKEVPDKALSTIFYLNVGIGLLCTALLFLGSHLIGNFYGSELLISVTRVISITYLLQSFVLVQRANLIKNHLFKTIAIADITSNLVAGIVAVIMAVNGLHVWSIVAMYVLQIFIANCLIWFKSDWWPKFEFELASIRNLWKYGSKVLLSGFLVFANNRIDLLMTGKFFSSAQQGIYSRAKDYGTMPSGIIIGIISKSYFPIFSHLQDDHAQLKQNYFKALTAMSFVGGLLFPLLFLCSGDAVLIVLKEKWKEMIPILQIFIVLSSFQVFNSVNINFLAGIGRSKTNLTTFAIIGPLRVLSVICYFLMAGSPSLVPVSIILTVFSFLETSLSFYFIARYKHYLSREQYFAAYRNMGSGWLIAALLFWVSGMVFDHGVSSWTRIFIFSISYGIIYMALCYRYDKAYLLTWLRQLPIVRNKVGRHKTM